MNKNGFTLVELLAVILLLGLIMVLVLPNINNASGATKQKSFETKVSFIESAAILYGQDNYGKIVNNNNGSVCATYKKITSGYECTIKVITLVPSYLTADSQDAVSGKYIADPRDNSKYLDNTNIKITINSTTRKVTATYQGS